MTKGRREPLARSAALAAGLVLAAAVAAATPVPTHSITWRPGYAAAMKEAKASGKPVLLVFYTTWCAYCAKMEATTLRAPQVVSTIEGFVPTMVDAERDVIAAQRFEPAGFPVVVVVDSRGEEVVRFLGYQPPEKFGPALAAIRDRISEFSRLSGQLGNKDRAERARTLSLLGDLFSSAGFHERASEHYQKALKLADWKDSSASEDLLRRAADAARLAGENTAAQRHYRRLLAEFPSSGREPEYLLGLGRSLLGAGRVDQARAVLARIEAEHAGTPQATEASQLLAGAKR